MGGHGDRLTKLLGGHKSYYDGQRPLTGCYFKYCVIYLCVVFGELIKSSFLHIY